VLIPARNTEALMLRNDVVQAIAEERFHIYAIDAVEEGIELLTGVPAGALDHAGRYAENTVYGAIQARLDRFRQVLKH
jgi:predicted ATP-dependent protease